MRVYLNHDEERIYIIQGDPFADLLHCPPPLWKISRISRGRRARPFPLYAVQESGYQILRCRQSRSRAGNKGQCEVIRIPLGSALVTTYMHCAMWGRLRLGRIVYCLHWRVEHCSPQNSRLSGHTRWEVAKRDPEYKQCFGDWFK